MGFTKKDKNVWPILLIFTLIAALPFNGLFGQILTKQTGSEEIKLFLNVILLFASLVMILFFAMKTNGLAETKKLIDKPYNRAAIIFGLVNIIYLFVGNVVFKSEIYGLLLNCRLVIIFIAMQCAFISYKSIDKELFLKMIGLSGGVIAFSALLQQLFPGFVNFQVKLGYEVANLSIDGNESLIRSTGVLRGPNELGAYMIIIFFISLYFILKYLNNKKLLFLWTLILVMSTGVLYYSYSRSAYIGLLVGLIAWLILYFRKMHKARLVTALRYAGPILLLVIALAISLATIPSTRNYISNVVFHADPQEASNVNSDDVRLNFWKNSLDQISDNPFGYGTGSAGPASVYGKSNINENYYLQIFIELGLIGFISLTAWIIFVAMAIFRNYPSRIVNVLIPMLFGLLIVNMFLHTWTDEAVAIVCWSLLGYYIIYKPHDKNSTNKT